MNILLTNDDSHESPLFLLAIEMLQSYGRVTIVVPAQEQSWKGKSMTRFGALYVDKIDIHGTSAFSVTGTPADCVNLGIYNLMDERPDIVVSGINLGINTGLGFLLSSGTLGACLEANIAGVSGLALSQHLSAEEYREWTEDRYFSPDSVARLKGVVEQIMPAVWQEFVVDQPSHATTWSVNLPYELVETDIIPAILGGLRRGNGRGLSEKRAGKRYADRPYGSGAGNVKQATLRSRFATCQTRQHGVVEA